MEYDLAIEGGPASIPGGTAVLLLHPSTGETDRIDTEFLAGGTDPYLVVSTRTTAREVKQKLDHYGVDPEQATILDTLSIERGLSRRRTNDIHYVSAPDDIDAIIQHTEAFLADTDGRRRISVDSISELSYYANEEQATAVLERLAALLEEYEAIGIFHVDAEVHDGSTIERFRSLCDGVLELEADGSLTATF